MLMMDAATGKTFTNVADRARGWMPPGSIPARATVFASSGDWDDDRIAQ